jgi:aconitate hydratase
MAKIFFDELSFDPSARTLTTPAGEEFSFAPPVGDALPS